jgi:hypothetical protein
VCGFVANNSGTINAELACKWSLLLKGGFGFALFAFGSTVALPVVAVFFSIFLVTNHHGLWVGALLAVVISSARAGFRLSAVRRKVDVDFQASRSSL